MKKPVKLVIARKCLPTDAPSPLWALLAPIVVDEYNLWSWLTPAALTLYALLVVGSLLIVRDEKEIDIFDKET
jgi:hypothetical protein